MSLSSAQNAFQSSAKANVRLKQGELGVIFQKLVL